MSQKIVGGSSNVRKKTLINVQLNVLTGPMEETARFVMEYADRYSNKPYDPFLLMPSIHAKPAIKPYRR
jgi:hypothetical protein